MKTLSTEDSRHSRRIEPTREDHRYELHHRQAQKTVRQEERHQQVFNRVARNHLRTEPDDIREHSLRALTNLKASANESISRLMDMPRCLQKATFEQRVLDQRARSIAQTVQSVHREPSVERKHEESRIRDLTIRYEERERLLLQEVDNLKRKESYYSQETESLRKVNESLQQELDSVRKAPGVEDIGKVLTLEQENQELRAELDELRDQLSRSRVLTNSDAYRYRSEALELRQHVGKLQHQLSRLDERTKAESDGNRTAHQRLAQIQKQSAHLVLQNCELRNQLARSQQKLQSATYTISDMQNDRVLLTELTAKLKFYEQENIMLQRENTTIASSFNPVATSGLLVGRQQPHPRRVQISTNRNSMMHGRVKTEADSGSFDRAPQRSSFSRYDKQPSKQQGGEASTEKERLNDAIVKRCKLTLAPH